MTSAEKAKKILSAEKDISTLNNILESGNFQKAENAITKILYNLDYAKAITVSRVKHNVPFGNLPFGSLKFIQQRNAILMLLDAVKATLSELELTPTNDKEEK